MPSSLSTRGPSTTRTRSISTRPSTATIRYRVRGRAGDTRHWRGQAPAASGSKAPQYVIFETPSGWAGDSGSIAELRPGSRANGGVLDSSKLEVAPDGSFEILLAPSRPEGHRGNFLATTVHAPGEAARRVARERPVHVALAGVARALPRLGARGPARSGDHPRGRRGRLSRAAGSRTGRRAAAAGGRDREEPDALLERVLRRDARDLRGHERRRQALHAAQRSECAERGLARHGRRAGHERVRRRRLRAGPRSKRC